MTSISLLKQEISRILPAFEIREEEPLARHTSFRIGGPAELMVFPRTVEELSGVMACAAAHSVRPRILGAGTNVLAPDEGLRGLVIVTREALMGLALRDGTQVEAMAGMSLAETAMFAARNRLSGLEFAHGIPGTVGGALYMNAGAYGGELCQVALRTEYMDLSGRCRWVEGAEQGFAYRSSAFQSMEGVIVRTLFALEPGEETAIRARMQELAQKRRASQPLELPSAGSAFKRPQGAYAAALIEQAGLKGLRVGGAAVSEKHAGFIVNLGGATAADVLRLVELVQERVLADSGFRLEPEVRLWKR